MRTMTILTTTLCLLASGCGEDSAATQEAATTYHRDVAPLLTQACTSCHVTGASAPFGLETFESAKTWAAASVTAISSGRMPPWLPDPSCREFTNQRVAPEGMAAVLESWIAEGMPEGDEQASVGGDMAVEPVFTFEPTHIASMVEPYLPDVSLPDDYRCFVLDIDIPEERFLLSSRAVPEQKALVHHILVYAVSGSALTEVLEADAAEGSGYTCFGAPFPSSEAGASLSAAAGLPILVGAWVPGGQALAPNPELSTHIPAGSRIIMQIHYNTLAGDVVADNSSFEMMLSEEPTPFLAAARPVLLPGLFAAANDPAAVNKHLFKNYTDEPITIVSLGPHMHLLGSRYKAEVIRASGETECAIEIPDWDFNWQERYHLQKEAPIVLAPGDGITLECEYDNTLANQPSINGVIEDPADIRWGEGTRDEMCMNYLTMIEPYEPSQAGDSQCAGADECLASCEDGRTDMECLLDCDAVQPACLSCLLGQTIVCASGCMAELLALRDAASFGPCFVNRMAMGSSLDRCLAAEATEAYEAFASCTAVPIEAGDCKDAWAGCGISLSEPGER